MTCSSCGTLFISDGPFRNGRAYPKPLCFPCDVLARLRASSPHPGCPCGQPCPVAEQTHCLDCGKTKDQPGVPAICAAWHDQVED